MRSRFGPSALRHVALAVLAVAPLAAQQQGRPPAADSADIASIDAVVTAAYSAISGPAGTRNWDRFRSLFAPGARLIPTRVTPNGGAEAVVLDVDGYIARATPYLERNAFFERELARRVEQFGNIAHVFSSYASYRSAQDSVPFSRGINSFQLLRDGTHWWIVTIYWDAERPGVALPSQYLHGP